MLAKGAKVLIVGGTRYLGRLLAEEALEAGADVTLLNRGRTPDAWLGERAVRRVHGDRNDPVTLAQAFDRDYDAVFDMIAYRAEDITPLLQAAVAAHIGHLVVCSTTSVYAPALYQPIDEDHPRGLHPAWGDYNKGKNAVEDLVLGTPTTILRPQWVFGPHDYQHLAEFYLARIATGRPIWLWHPGVAQLNWTYASDLARAFVHVAGDARARGNAYNVGCDETLTGLDFLALCGEVLETRPDVRWYDPAGLPGELRGDRVGVIRNLPLACTAQRLKDTFGWRPTPMREALGQTAQWLRESGAFAAVEPTSAEQWLSNGGKGR